MGIVFDAPLFDDDLGFAQGVEKLAIQAFVAELTVETFAIAILPRAARFDVERRSAYCFEPGAQFPSNKFWGRYPNADVL